MVINPINQGTIANFGVPIMPGTTGKEKKKTDNSDRIRCIQQGGTWDEATKTCSLPGFEYSANPENVKIAKTEGTEPQKAQLTTPETFTNPQNQRASGITLPDGRTFLGLSPEEVNAVALGEQARIARPEGTNPVGTAQGQVNQAFQAQQMQGQVGQFGELPINPTGLNYGEAATTGIINAIPKALNYAVLGAGAGAAGGAFAGGIGAAPGAVIGAVGGFVSGIASSMVSNLKSQRTDTTNAQKRVLDEGKQTMKDWATLAAADPANREYYLSQYNKVSAQINQAYRQMKLDTSRDVAKFETALPDLAEFEAFYSTGGERDTLDLEMRNALLSPASVEYQMLELANRRYKQ